MGGPYYAIETPGKFGYEYDFLLFSEDGILRWEAGSESIIDPVFSNVSLQRNLGVSCFEKTQEKPRRCKVGSVQTLKNILAFILNQNLTPTVMYRVG